jgi:HK97 family phage prohead protease
MPNVNRKAPDKEHTQSVCFYKDKWSKEEAKKWCKDHDYYTDGLDETDNLFRFRQYDPDDTKFRYRNQVIEKDSIFLVIGYPKGKSSASQDREYRNIPFDQFELREGEGEAPKLVGYASVFNEETIIFGLWREKVAPGAFKKTIQEHDIRALWNHNTDLVLGRNKAGTLKLSEDDHGLYMENTPPDTQAGRDAVTSIKRKDVTQMSIAFNIIKQEWLIPENKREMPLRTILEAKLYEVSPVTFPAFESTSVSARSEDGENEEEIDPLEEARRIYRCMKRGMPLTIEQRAVMQTAVDLYQPYLLEPEPEGHHSSEHESEPEQDHWEPQPDSHYSAEERERRLKELSNQIYPNSQGDNHEYS